MDITFSCSNCGQQLEVEESGAGLAVPCPKCGKSLTIPTASTPVATALKKSTGMGLAPASASKASATRPAKVNEFLCGNCGAVCPVEEKSMPAVSKTCVATIDKGKSLRLPLSTWNSLILCQECKEWNWNTDDERITSFTFPCPTCGVSTHFGTLGRKYTPGKDFLTPLVIGDWRLAGKNLPLKCGHTIYLPKLSKDNQFRVPVAAPTTTPKPSPVPHPEKSVTAPTPATKPTSAPEPPKSKTQKISPA